jgi:hypothetical protein
MAAQIPSWALSIQFMATQILFAHSSELLSLASLEAAAECIRLSFLSLFF